MTAVESASAAREQRRGRGAPVRPVSQRLPAGMSSPVRHLTEDVRQVVHDAYPDSPWQRIVERLTPEERESLGGGDDRRLGQYLSAQFGPRARKGPAQRVIPVLLAHCLDALSPQERDRTTQRIQQRFDAVHGPGCSVTASVSPAPRRRPRAPTAQQIQQRAELLERQAAQAEREAAELRAELAGYQARIVALEAENAALRTAAPVTRTPRPLANPAEHLTGALVRPYTPQPSEPASPMSPPRNPPHRPSPRPGGGGGLIPRARPPADDAPGGLPPVPPRRSPNAAPGYPVRQPTSVPVSPAPYLNTEASPARRADQPSSGPPTWASAPPPPVAPPERPDVAPLTWPAVPPDDESWWPVATTAPVTHNRRSRRRLRRGERWADTLAGPWADFPVERLPVYETGVAQLKLLAFVITVSVMMVLVPLLAVAGHASRIETPPDRTRPMPAPAR